MSRKSTDQKISLTGTYIGETAKAVRLSITHIGTGKLKHEVAHWFPFSQISKSTKSAAKLGTDTLIVSAWIMREKKLIGPGSEGVEYESADLKPETTEDINQQLQDAGDYNDIEF